MAMLAIQTSATENFSRARSNARADSSGVSQPVASERIVRRTSLVTFGQLRCQPDDLEFGYFYTQDEPRIAFSRSTVRRVAKDGAARISTLNEVEFYNIGDGHARHAVSAHGEISDWIELSPRILQQLVIDQVAGRPGAMTGKPFDRPFAPIGARTYLAQRHLFLTLCDDPYLSDLELEEYVLELVAAILQEANTHWQRDVVRTPFRTKYEMRRKAIVEAAKQILDREYRLNDSLATLAQRVGCCATVLMRLFVRETGFTLHDYRQQLRLRHAVEMLSNYESDMSLAAHALGFASHSHFSYRFREHFGMTPTQFMRSRSRSLMSSMLDSLLPRKPRPGSNGCADIRAR